MHDHAQSTSATDVAIPTNARRLALGAVAGPVLFTLAWLILGFLSPGFSVGGDWISPYSPISHPISGLGMGETGPYMNAAIIVSGLMITAGLVGVFQTMRVDGRRWVRWAGPAALALSPLGLVVAGIFNLDHLFLHFVGFGLVVTPVVTFVTTGLFMRRISYWRRFGAYLIVAGPLTLPFTILFLVSFDQAAAAANQGMAGIAGRLLPSWILAWFAAMGWRAFRSP